MSKGIWIGLIIVAVLVIVGILLLGSGNDEDVNISDSLDNLQEVPAPGVIDGNTDEMIVNDEKQETEEIIQTQIVQMSSSGFSPKILTVKKGDIVMFKAVDNSNRWPASDVHPTHREYPGSGLSKCGTSEAEEIFDACRAVKQGESWSFTFDEVGTWDYHDHGDSGETGKIIVR